MEELDFEYFLKHYIIDPEYDVTISFSFKSKIYQFDFVNVEKNSDGTSAYEFVVYENGWDSNATRTRYSSLLDAINNAKIDGHLFEELFNLEEFDLIDVS